MRKMYYLGAIELLMVSVFLTSCSQYLHQPMQTQEAQIGFSTPQKKVLESLPEPQEKVVCAVYNFRDQTGQYKPSETGASWSTAVTQGATSVLIKALEESKWFIVIERENISNLLNERKIIRSSRQQYGQNSGNQILLPPLLYAGVILEGGIISYESNIRTGGAGLRYFGAGGSGEYREDRVSIYLRAVSSSNGKIIKTVYTTKSILSQKVNASLFRYVKLKRVLEAETGYTYNEPAHMAVKEAIEKAVVSLVVEGIQEKLWNVNKPADTTHYVIQDYEKEQRMSENTNAFGIAFDNQREGIYRIGLKGGIMSYQGDYKNEEYKAVGSFSFGYKLDDSWSVQLSSSMGEYHAANRFTDQMISGDLGLNYLIVPRDKISPEIGIGIGIISLQNADNGNFQFNEYVSNARAGIEIMVGKGIGLRTSGGFHYLFSDDTDGIRSGRYNDFFWSAQLGLKIYFGN